MRGTGQKMRRIQVMLAAAFSLCIMACGKETQAVSENGVEMEGIIEDSIETETGIKSEEVESASGKDEVDSASAEDTPLGDEQETEQPENDNVITAYITENTEYTDEVIPVQYVDDLSLLADLKYLNSNYVYQDGKVYYRRYHEDSYEDAALWGDYDAIPGREKEIVCIDADGTETVLFTDKGKGDIYLINDRFYMTDNGPNENSVAGGRLYSVDMQGNDRIDYGNKEICVVDMERKIFILNRRDCYYVLNCETGEKQHLLHGSGDECIHVRAYQDGWIYYESYDDDSTICKLCAVSIEGEQREIIAITSADKEVYSYQENILDMEVDGDRIYFIFGGYSGSLNVFRGGMLISVKLDGTDYKAVKLASDTYYLSHDKGKTLVYFPGYHKYFREDDGSEEYETMVWVWDVETDICYLSDFPTDILYSYDESSMYSHDERIAMKWCYNPAEKGVLCDVMTGDAAYEGEGWRTKTDVYAIPDDSGRIVRVVMDIEKYTTIWEEEEAERVLYEDFYFADGFLYFKAEYSTYDKATSLGWRDGYRRLHTDIYRLKVGESEAEILYSY